ncbi:MAG: hypothetical protein MZU95_02810, partial [Desulfomicrobium escambiense]|nr:hypothetical protein [Desulfomicrobium escambiense]
PPASTAAGCAVNWFVTQMGSYIPGRLWMVLGRDSVPEQERDRLGQGCHGHGAGEHLSPCRPWPPDTACIAVHKRFFAAGRVDSCPLDLGGAWCPHASRPGIQRLFARKLARRLGTTVDELPHISHRHQAEFIGSHMLSWSLRGLGLYFWFRGFGVPPLGSPRTALVHPLRDRLSRVMACVASHDLHPRRDRGAGIAPGSHGGKPRVPGGMVVATAIALGQRLMLMMVEGVFRSFGPAPSDSRQAFPGSG